MRVTSHYKRMVILGAGALLLTLSLLSGCQSENRVYMHYQSIPDYKWSYDNQLPFSVTIKDTQALYNMYVVVRHNEKYPFRNLWTLMHTVSPSDERQQEKVELQLQRKDGKWYGAGLGGIMEVMVPVKEKYQFREPGTYTFKLEQHMRKNPLPGVMNVGLRIEQLPPQAKKADS